MAATRTRSRASHMAMHSHSAMQQAFSCAATPAQVQVVITTGTQCTQVCRALIHRRHLRRRHRHCCHLRQSRLRRESQAEVWPSSTATIPLTCRPTAYGLGKRMSRRLGEMLLSNPAGWRLQPSAVRRMAHADGSTMESASPDSLGIIQESHGSPPSHTLRRRLVALS